MKTRYKLSIGLVLVIALAQAALEIEISYESECPPPVESSAGADTMKADLYYCYASREVLHIAHVEIPESE